MAMDATQLEISIIDIMEQVHSEQPEVQVGVAVTQTPKEDGTLETTIEPEMGRPPFDRDAVVPLARAVARAVVDHITSHAEVDDNGLAGTPAGTWRIS